MTTSAPDRYLETQVATATPQRLRLMLIEEALRQARLAEDHWKGGQAEQAASSATRCRDILGELIAGIQPDRTPVAKQVLGLYLYLFSSLIEAQLAKDIHQLAGVIRVLEEERETWQEVCRLNPEQLAAGSAPLASREELAPRRVAAMSPSLAGASTSSFTIDA